MLKVNTKTVLKKPTIQKNAKCRLCENIIQWSEFNSHMDLHKSVRKECLKYSSIVYN